MFKDPAKEINPWKTLTNETVYDTPWISVSRHEVLNPHGNPGVYSVVHFKNYAVGVIPLDEELNTYLVGQYRYPLKQYSWEIIEGGCPKSEKPEDAARRELHEEAGISADNLKLIQTMHLSNSATDEIAYIYVATGLTFHQSEPEDTEELDIKKVSLKEAYDLVMSGEITDSLSVAGIMKCWIMQQKGGLSNK